MNDIAELSRADGERMFADWGVPVILRQVTSTAVPGTGLVSDVTRDWHLTAIVRGRQRQPTPGTAIRHLGDDVEFVLRTDELPAAVSLVTSRIMYQGREYSLAESMTAADGGVVIVHGQRV